MEALKLIAILALAGCGRIDFTALAGDAPAGGSDAAAACLGTGTFTNVQAMTAVNDQNTQYGTFISPDGLTLVWDQPNGVHEQLFMSQRANRADPFPAGAPIPGAFPDGNVGDGSMTADLLELFFASDAGGNLCLYHATRASTAVAFDPAVKLTALCAGLDTTGAGISADGLTLAYNSSADANAEGDLYITERVDRTADFPAGKKLNNLPALIGYPWLSADRLRIWFEEEIGPDFEIVSAQRISPSDDFSSVHGVTEIDSGTSNGDPALTEDESVIAFSSTRVGSWDVYTASRPCL